MENRTVSKNDEIYGKEILHNFHEQYRYEYPNKEEMPLIVETNWESPKEPKLTYFEEHVLRLLDSIYGLLEEINYKP